MVYLGHGRDLCTSGISKRIIVMHVNGIHIVNANFCECGMDMTGLSHYTQILRAHWFPATPTNPSTAFTLQLLDLFEVTSFKGKISGHDFYSAISMLRDNSCGGSKIVTTFTHFSIYICWPCQIEQIHGIHASYPSFSSPYAGKKGRKRTRPRWYWEDEAGSTRTWLSCLSSSWQKSPARLGKRW